jgi:hypothetical protein
MELTKDLNLVFIVENDVGNEFPIIATPIDYLVYQSHLKTLTALNKELIENVAEQDMPIVAYDYFISMNTNSKGQLIENAKSLLREIMRNCFVITDGNKVLLETLEFDKVFSEWTIADIKSRLLFFTLKWSLSPRLGIQELLDYKLYIYAKSRCIYLNSMEFIDSWMTAKANADTPARIWLAGLLRN